ncbi:hypothetical protein PPACK8108_LOCUS7780 [Phakopsora pachyrhizi]|uniref:Uncharacterized protein n=1 Tax=Phakopsora pachyrhizi TaxID=170000 RepID=A0AAV0AUY9_PHAPC|nr:hypothetical protein PPACK8108_LOCUS7780 [Phakopsora pachyrhizi]
MQHGMQYGNGVICGGLFGPKFLMPPMVDEIPPSEKYAFFCILLSVLAFLFSHLP